MIDIKFIRNNKDQFAALMKRRGISDSIIEKILFLDKELREKNEALEILRNERNILAKQASTLDKFSDEFRAIKINSEKLKREIKETEEDIMSFNAMETVLSSLPNPLDDNVPAGDDENSNKFIKSFGQKPDIQDPLSHEVIGAKLGMISFDTAREMSGSRFVTTLGMIAKLERALTSFMMDIHTENGFIEVSPPYLVKNKALYNTGQLPKFSDDSFAVEGGYRLIPTAEVSLVNMFAGQLLKKEDLPIRMVASTPCFRSEAGSAGKDTKGLIRLHQFSKVEMVSFCTPQKAYQEHEFLLSCSESILKKLGLPYRVMLLCAGDTGFSASKTYDIEVWFPSQEKYREIASCSNCGSFQSVRMMTRYTSGITENKKTNPHTLNSSGLPIGRTLAAIMENFQNSDGSVTIPPALVEYMGGVDKIEPNKISYINI
jgi:seryl-tRNA synthetase